MAGLCEGGNEGFLESHLSSANDNSACMCSANDKSALYRYKTASIDYSRICNRKRISEKSRRLEIQYCRRRANLKSKGDSASLGLPCSELEKRRTETGLYELC
ncbi:hypothetical protein ANN_11849 [Periplaneta americana]|uniref:Uncharacterized protein n=1 Tax=Periplaneta americana TaxID=6978 RepID=A0ABQ8T667_PERAM|nr:hypothetical protein ANN_11849 [Periplaneta americana]